MNRKAFLMIAAAIAMQLGSSAKAEEKKAMFAGGCFWCMEKDFEHVDGVIEVVSGYAGGNTSMPTYKNYAAGGHIEVVEITYDSDKTNFDNLLHTFWRSINPTDAGGQFCDRGHAYTTAVFALDDKQKKKAEDSKQELVQSRRLKSDIVTPILDGAEFWPAEEYHQNYYKKSPLRYTYYRRACGRDKTIKALWGNEAHSGITH